MLGASQVWWVAQVGCGPTQPLIIWTEMAQASLYHASCDHVDTCDTLWLALGYISKHRRFYPFPEDI